jgi:hypothetical protein
MMPPKITAARNMRRIQKTCSEKAESARNGHACACTSPRTSKRSRINAKGRISAQDVVS